VVYLGSELKAKMLGISASSLTAVVSHIAYSSSEVIALAQVRSQLESAASNMTVMYTSDVSAGMTGSDACSDLVVHVSNLIALFSNALI